MPLSANERVHLSEFVSAVDPSGTIVRVDLAANLVFYGDEIRSHETKQRAATNEELARAAGLAILTRRLGYPADRIWIERYFEHGRAGTTRDEVDLIINDADDLAWAMWEFKSPDDFARDQDTDIRRQLYGTSPLVGAPPLLVYATTFPTQPEPTLGVLCIDRTLYPSYETWSVEGRPYATQFPSSYRDPRYEPFTKGGTRDLRTNASHADFVAAAAAFHQEFFGEHPDNTLYTNLMKCLLAKIVDERNTATGSQYNFQVLAPGGREESADAVFARVNSLYRTAYSRYIDPGTAEPDEINVREFSPERVKTVVRTLQGMSITQGAALQADVIGGFFEEILRSGFKQDKGMYFTHANLVHFMTAAVDLEGLAVQVWQRATHPENRLPYIADPACGSGSFLLRAMQVVTQSIRGRRHELVNTEEARLFYDARMSDVNPNYWAESFLYGLDPKFVMAITAKVNMVLHGDGSAHVFKTDGLLPLSSYPDPKLRQTAEPTRTIPRDRYSPDLAESFDLILTNPPFGTTLSSDARRGLGRSFSLPSTTPSEQLFLERWFQLLRAGGRLGAVVPESLLNTGDATTARMFLFRCFWIRAVVSLPRNMFIDTPTLTSLLFAQKKSAGQIERWDSEPVNELRRTT